MESLDKIMVEEVMAMMPFPVDKQFISSQELHEAGYSNYKIRQMVSAGDLINVNRKWYENAHYTGEINDFYAVSAYAEQGVVCLISAAVYHELSSERPNQIDVAIPRNVRIPESPDWPTMKFYRMVEPRYSMGIVEVNEGGNSFRIYDREKTVCDVIYHRNKMGFEPAMEVLKRYVKQPDRDINRLIAYAKSLQVETTIKQYLEALL
jgi:predicted transcriptional regulator of viral defense system